MEKEHALLKGDLRITTGPQKRRRSVWFFVGLQLLTGVVSIVLLNLFHIRFQWIWPCQWVAIISLWYWQFRSSPIPGIEITLESGFVSKWAVIEMGSWPELGIVYRTAVGVAGSVTISVFPFSPSRYKLVNSLKFLLIKFAVWARIIK